MRERAKERGERLGGCRWDGGPSLSVLYSLTPIPLLLVRRISHLGLSHYCRLGIYRYSSLSSMHSFTQHHPTLSPQISRFLAQFHPQAGYKTSISSVFNPFPFTSTVRLQPPLNQRPSIPASHVDHTYNYTPTYLPRHGPGSLLIPAARTCTLMTSALGTILSTGPSIAPSGTRHEL